MNTPQPLNQLLKTKRQELGINLTEVEQNTRIAKSHLRALEEKNFGELPSGIYTKNFIKSYAEYLEIRDSESIKQFVDEFTLFHRQTQENEHIKNSMHRGGMRIIDLPRIFKAFVVLSVLATSLFYLGSGIKKIFQPPFLEVTEPNQNIITQATNITIQGHTEPEAEVTINDSTILGDGEGNFFKTIDLVSGMNFIEITARTKHGKSSTITRQVLVESANTHTETPKEITRK